MSYLHSVTDTEIDAIDRSSRRMLNILDNLYRLAWQQEGGEAIFYGTTLLLPPLFPEVADTSSPILAAVKQLHNYCLKHFPAEESLLEKAVHPHLLRHYDAHLALQEQVTEIRHGLGDDKRGRLHKIVALVSNVLFHHEVFDRLDFMALRAARQATGVAVFPEAYENIPASGARAAPSASGAAV